MQHTSKMVMVPQDAYTNLLSQQKQLYSPVVNQLSSLDQELQAILADPNLSSDAKYHRYMAVFGRYQNFKSQQMKNATVQMPVAPMQPEMDVPPPADLPIREQQLIGSLPFNVRRKGKMLLNHIKSDPDHFKWQKSGELVVDGTPVPASNITDLFHYATRDRKTAKSPAGFKEFKKLLDETNVPREALNQSQPLATPSPKLGTSFSPLAFSTPRGQEMPEHSRSGEKAGTSQARNKPYPARQRKQTQRYGGNWTQYRT